MARYGPAAAAAFRTHAGTLKPFPAKRLGQLWRSALLRGFRAVAAEGAFWVARPARPEPPRPGPPPEAPAEAPNLALRDARRIELKNQLRKRHQEVANAHGWTVKTPPEIAERDRYLAQLRATIAALEAELEALRG
jgi:hypothetical protein